MSTNKSFSLQEEGSQYFFVKTAKLMTSYPSIYFVWRENSNSIVLILEPFANPIHTSCLMSYERHGQFESPTTFEKISLEKSSVSIIIIELFFSFLGRHSLMAGLRIPIQFFGEKRH